MSDYVLFQMWEPFRQSLIAGHLFYVEQARKRLLSQFDDIETEADEASTRWLDQRAHLFDPERHDPGDFYEGANDAGIEFYQMLSDMRERTRLSVAAGMFHEWDKQLRGWLVGEVRHWHNGDAATQKIWGADFNKIAELLESLGWKVRHEDYFKKLDACRLVVNVYKHGDGTSLRDLHRDYPQYIDDPLKEIASPSFAYTAFLDHSNLKVTDKQLLEFSSAIVEFWKNVPKNIFQSQVTTIPDWFEKAIIKDGVGHNSKEKNPPKKASS